jgi:hypothetical protein
LRAERPIFPGVSHVSSKAARTAKQFPAVPSGSTTIEWIRLLGPRKIERSRRITAVCGLASMLESTAQVHYRVVGFDGRGWKRGAQVG